MTIWDGVVKSLEPLARQSLPDLCSSTRGTKSNRRPGGAYDETPVAVLTDEPCRVTPTSLASATSLVAEATEVLNRWQVAMWRGADLAVNDILTASGTDNDGNAWTRKLVVISVDGPRTYEVLRTATCSELSTSGR